MPVDPRKTYIGIVQENQDPQKMGRVKIRVVGVFDQMELKDIPWATPWKDLNGNGFNVPEIGKLLTVVFDSGNEYKPEYIFADFYNVNLEKKIKSLEGSNYTSMKALIFDHKTQVYVNDSEGLKLDHKFNHLNIKESQINLALKDNFTKLNLGDSSADQQSILGTSFLSWFDKFVNALMCLQGPPYLVPVPITPSPAFLSILQEYHALKIPKFLSKNVFIVDNGCITSIKNDTSVDPNLRVNDSQIGDNIKTNVIELKTPKQNDKQDFTPTEGNGTEQPEKVTKTGEQLPLSQNIGEVPQTPVPTEDVQTKIPDAKPNETVNKIIDVMSKTKDSETGKFYTIEDKPYVINLVGVRKTLEGQPYPNTFTDEMWAIWKNSDGKWESQKWAATTVPGLFWSGDKLMKVHYRDTVQAEYFSSKLNKKVSRGVGILVPGQYDYTLSEGFGKGYENPFFQGPFLSCTKQACYRDRNWESSNMTFSDPDDYFPDKIDFGSHGMMIHMAFYPTSDRRDLGCADEQSLAIKHFQPPTSGPVNTWSLGSQTIPNQNDWIQLLNLVRRSIAEKGQNNIKYTIINESQLADFDPSGIKSQPVVPDKDKLEESSRDRELSTTNALAGLAATQNKQTQPPTTTAWKPGELVKDGTVYYQGDWSGDTPKPSIYWKVVKDSTEGFYLGTFKSLDGQSIDYSDTDLQKVVNITKNDAEGELDMI